MTLTKAILYLIAIFYTLQSYAQSEAAIWYFGDNAGVDFNSGVPVVLDNGQLDTLEGCSTISDSNGELLFYSDGISVWNKNHNLMPNGTNLFGDPSSTQSGLIVPKPGDNNIYYIFTLDDVAGPNGLRYTEVDMSLDNGNGDVTNTKNVLLRTSCTEKISAVTHSNGSDIWVMTHEWDNNTFLAFLITSNGIDVNNVVTSNVGSVHTGDLSESIGYLKFSPDGKRVAIAKWSNDTFVELFDFDDTTGVVSNPIYLDGIFYEGENNGVYGVEFSLDSNLLYLSDLSFSTLESRVYQLDITFNDAQQIINSNAMLYSGFSILGALQLAIDQKIYISNTSSGNLDVIENPNVRGIGANFISNAINLQPGIAQFGLPPFIQSFFSANISFENTCIGDSTIFSTQSSDAIISANWDFGDGSTSTELTPTHTYENSGVYTVTLEVSTAEETKSFEREITIYNIPNANIITDYKLCDDSFNDGKAIFDLTSKDTEILNTQSSDEFSVGYFLSLEDAENHANILPSSYENDSNNQTIYAKVYSKGNVNCYDITSFNLIVSVFPVINPLPDIVACDNEVADQSYSIIFDDLIPNVLGNQNPDDFRVSFYRNQDDAIAGSNVLTGTYNTETNPQDLFFKIENIADSSCYDISSFNVTITGQIIAYQPYNMLLCDDLSFDGIETFNLENQNPQIIGDQTGSYNITYYTNQDDALTRSNAINTNYTNTTNPEIIYTRIEEADNPNCFDITAFEIEVKAPPVLDMEETYYLCLGEQLTLYAQTGFNSYEWSNGAGSFTTTISEAGSYSLTVTKTYNSPPGLTCSYTHNFEIVASDEAVFQNFQVQDWTATNNTIAVFVDGIGDYEFSLDGDMYQDSNQFYGLEPGDYNIYIRDKNGCGTIVEEVYLMHYPKFFTPNGDSYNDLWQIIVADNEPDLEIFILNRQGKLLTTLNPLSPGWDGKYNEKLMPTDDYWFIVKRPKNGKTYTGHFTLKR